MQVLAATLALITALAGGTTSLPAGTNTALGLLGQRIAETGCSSPAKPEIRNASNPNHDEFQDQYVTTRCRSITIVRYRANSYQAPLDLLDSVILDGSHPLLPRQLRIGASPEDVITFAGEPDSRTAQQLVYHLNDEGPGTSTATFAFRRNRLQSITWSWFIE